MSQLDNWLHDTRDFLKSEGLISCLYGNNFFQDHIMTDVDDMVALIDERYETCGDCRPMLADEEELGEDFTDEEDTDDELEEEEDDWEDDWEDTDDELEEDEEDEEDDDDWEDTDDELEEEDDDDVDWGDSDDED